MRTSRASRAAVDGLTEDEQALAQRDELVRRRDLAGCDELGEAGLDGVQVALRSSTSRMACWRPSRLSLLAHATDPRDGVEGVQVASVHELTSPFSRCHVVAVSVGSSIVLLEEVLDVRHQRQGGSASSSAPVT